MTKRRGGALLAFALMCGLAVMLSAANVVREADGGAVVVWPEEDHARFDGRVRRKQLASRDDRFGARRSDASARA